MCIGVLPACMSAPHVLGAHCAKYPVTGVTEMVGSCHVGAEN